MTVTNHEFFMQCWEDEFPVFVNVLRAAPADKLEYRPAPNSRSMADLVWLQVIEKRCWFELLEQGTITWTLSPPPAILDQMVAAYEQAHALLAPLIQKVNDKTWNQKPALFIVDGRVLFETHMGHMFWLGLFDAIHHRGQLATYIRAAGGKVPAIYGPSADDEKDLHTPYLGLGKMAVSAP
jgi:uncharacterized damage-inducible protein DinB